MTRAELLGSLSDELVVAMESVSCAIAAFSRLCAELHDYEAEEAEADAFEAARAAGEVFFLEDIAAAIAKATRELATHPPGTPQHSQAQADLTRFTEMDVNLRAFVAKSERASRVYEAAAALAEARRAGDGAK